MQTETHNYVERHADRQKHMIMYKDTQTDRNI